MMEGVGELTEIPIPIEENEEGHVPDMVIIDNSHCSPLLMTGTGQASRYTCHMDSLLRFSIILPKRIPASLHMPEMCGTKKLSNPPKISRPLAGLSFDPKDCKLMLFISSCVAPPRGTQPAARQETSPSPMSVSTWKVSGKASQKMLVIEQVLSRQRMMHRNAMKRSYSSE